MVLNANAMFSDPPSDEFPSSEFPFQSGGEGGSDGTLEIGANVWGPTPPFPP